MKLLSSTKDSPPALPPNGTNPTPPLCIGYAAESPSLFSDRLSNALEEHDHLAVMRSSHHQQLSL